MALPDLKHVQAGEHRISYREAGSGPALFLVHGMGCGSVNWETQYARFADRFRVIGWDAPGYGESTAFDTDLASVADYVMAMEAFLDALGVDAAHLVGHSYGGIMVTGFHRAYPQRVLSLTLAQPVTGGGQQKANLRDKGIKQRFAEIEELGMAKYAALHAPRSCGPNVEPAALEKAIALTAAIPRTGYLRQFRSLRHANIHEWTSRPLAPAMIVSGEHDATASKAMVGEISDAMGGLRHETIPDIGHMIYLEHPERFNALLEGLLGEAGKGE